MIGIQVKTFALAAMTAVVVLASGCGKDDCEALYDKMKQCNPEEAKEIPKGAFVEICKAAKKAKVAEVTSSLACAKKGSCEDFKACEESGRLKQNKEELNEKIAEAKKTNNFEDALMECRINDDLLAKDAEAKKACDELSAAAATGLMEKVTKIRDEGSDEAFAACLDLKQIAEGAGDEVKAKAETLCKEADAASDLVKALAEVKANIDGKKADVPYECEATVKALGEITSEWATAKKAELVKACYLDLGKVVMEIEIPDMKYSCGYSAKQVYKAVKEHSISDPAMDAFMAQAAAKCEAE